MSYDAQVIAILPPIPAAPRCFHDECVPVNAVHSVPPSAMRCALGQFFAVLGFKSASLGYEVRAPSLEKGTMKF